MEAEIERLYQIAEELSDRLKKIETDNNQINLSIFELNQKFESLRNAIISGIEV